MIIEDVTNKAEDQRIELPPERTKDAIAQVQFYTAADLASRRRFRQGRERGAASTGNGAQEPGDTRMYGHSAQSTRDHRIQMIRPDASRSPARNA
jgi:hypothetical protein